MAGVSLSNAVQLRKVVDRLGSPISSSAPSPCLYTRASLLERGKEFGLYIRRNESSSSGRRNSAHVGLGGVRSNVEGQRKRPKYLTVVSMYRGFGSSGNSGPRGEKPEDFQLINSIYALNGIDQWNYSHDLQRTQAVLRDDVATDSIAEVIDGKKIAKDIRGEIAQEVTRMKEAVGQVPGLAVVLVGNRTDSATYVRSKQKACEEVGIVSFGVNLPEDASEQDVLESIRKFNDDPAVHGILVQLPLPKHMNEEKVVGAISVEKDVDGFHPLNVGRLALQGRTPLFVSCTPKGCIELLLRSGVEIAGKHAVVVGRSNVVGMPAAILLQAHNATVTTVHSRTPNPAELTRSADIVIAAVGVANLVRGDWIKPGAVVIDVGINSVEDPTAKRGYRLVGDVCYQEAAKVASKITPVPGGVGPMTIAMLLQNTLESAKRSFDF